MIWRKRIKWKGASGGNEQRIHTEDSVDDVISGFQIPFEVFGEGDVELL